MNLSCSAGRLLSTPEGDRPIHAVCMQAWLKPVQVKSLVRKAKTLSSALFVATINLPASVHMAHIGLPLMLQQ